METENRKLISVVTPCYNEELNVDLIYKKVKEVFAGLPQYDYEHIFIDNCSKDKTVSLLKEICRSDSNVKLIVNVRNFGWIRSPYHALLQSNGDASILIVADLQDPPELIKEFLKRWEEGYKVVIGVKTEAAESKLMFLIRSAYYNLINRLSDTELIKNYTGFGLYDRQLISILKGIDDPYPYFRGLVSDIGFEIFRVPYNQPTRMRGISTSNFYALYDVGILGITNHSKVPLRLATFAGFVMSMFSLLVAFIYFVYKLVFWDWFNAGQAPMVIGLFFFASVQLLFIGIIGEYIGAIHTQILKRPLVIEKERINFKK
jgi:glycosyltransferase involved in cell wall biosynthesis